MSRTRLNYKNLVPKSLIDNGFILKGSLLFKPMNNGLLQGFCFEKVRTHLYVNVFFLPLFMKKDVISLTYGNRLKGRHKLGTLFLIDDENLIDSTQEIQYVIHKNEESVLSIKTIGDFIAQFHKRELHSVRLLEGLVFAAYFSNHPKKDELYTLFLKQFQKYDDGSSDWMKEMKEAIDFMVGLYDQGKSQELKSLFKENFDYSIKELKLEKYANVLRDD
ncbi:hypothetical protein [Flagellimonas sp. CMM7]|uniref:hypothetical protein n=1 Tax=Flagellimonas sp. CMM7 TaxID=2654676 RepID=UPI0013D12B86|nr:hypothetical protein [Flagellimonas sp. CMM7]UII80115.1 hypothetical protein LV704_01005 [Flagellimonas sp. CMM7]